MASTKMIMVVLSVVLMSWTTTNAQDATQQSCIQALVPCQPYLASEKPPKECCDPLTKAVETQLACLCAAFTNPALAASFNMTQAIMLPKNCGIKDAGPSMCSKVAPGPGSSSASGPSSSSTPSKTLPSPPPSGNGSSRSIALAGPLSGLMMILAGLMFY